jgi:hypothetical protein
MSKETQSSKNGAVQSEWLTILGDKVYKDSENNNPNTFDLVNMHNLRSDPSSPFAKLYKPDVFGGWCNYKVANSNEIINPTRLAVHNDTSTQKRIIVYIGNDAHKYDVEPGELENITMCQADPKIYVGGARFENNADGTIDWKELYKADPEPGAPKGRRTVIVTPRCTPAIENDYPEYARVLNNSSWWFRVDYTGGVNDYLAYFEIRSIEINYMKISDKSCTIAAAVNLDLRLKQRAP